jgi:hypothetical protein
VTPERFVLALDVCPHGEKSIALDDELGGSGITLTDRCCGRSERVKAWPLTRQQLLGVRDASENAICDLEAEDEDQP